MGSTVGRLSTFLFFWFIFAAGVSAQQPTGDEDGNFLERLEKKESAEGAAVEEETRAEIDEVIHHHMQDSYYYTLFSDSEKDKHYGIPLPVIIFDNGMKVFSSSKFDHGKELVTLDGQTYRLYDAKIYKTDSAGNLEFNDKGFAVNEQPWNFSITKNVVNILFTGLLMFLIFSAMARSYRKSTIPRGMTGLLEPIVLYIQDEIAIPTIGEKQYKKFMPFLLTIFFFIWILNMLGMTPLGVNVTGNITITTALALFTFIITNVKGNRTYWGHIFDPLGEGMPWYGKAPLYVLLIPIEILGIFIKPFSLLIRLFANMSAGHIIMMSLIGIIFIFKSWMGGPLTFLMAVFITLIEFFVALLQAYVFTILSALYFGFAVQEPEEAQ